MPKTVLSIDLADYRRIAEDAEAKGVTPRESIQYVWALGMAALVAEQGTQDNTETPEQQPEGVALLAHT